MGIYNANISETASFLKFALFFIFIKSLFRRYFKKLLTCTVLSIKTISRGALTGVRTIIVHAGGVHWTVVREALTLVKI